MGTPWRLVAIGLAMALTTSLAPACTGGTEAGGPADADAGLAATDVMLADVGQGDGAADGGLPDVSPDAPPDVTLDAVPDAAPDLVPDTAPDAVPDVGFPPDLDSAVADAEASPDVPEPDESIPDVPEPVDAADAPDPPDALAEVDAPDTKPDTLSLCLGKAPTTEVCNGVDDDCDGTIDTLPCFEGDDPMAGPGGCSVWYKDADGDGFGNKNGFACLCFALPEFPTQDNTDCKDNDAKVSPTGTEVCDAKDNDCDGITDNAGAQFCVPAYMDQDGDSFGLSTSKACVCGLGPVYKTFKAGDCNDTNAQTHPQAPELCNGEDDDCDTQVDEPNAMDCNDFYSDLDGDGFGAKSACLCAPDAPYLVTTGGDCNDAAIGLSPGATESCDGVDQDCDGQTDEGAANGCVFYYFDPEKDGIGDPATMAKCQCGPQGDWSALVVGACTQPGGCTCLGDGLSTGSCDESLDLGYAYDTDGTLLQTSGKVLTGEPGDWVRFHAIDYPDNSGSCDPFNVHIWLSDNPGGQFELDVYRGTCSPGGLLCSSEQDSNWTVSFSGVPPSGPGSLKGYISGAFNPSPVPEVGGECKCTNGWGLPGMNFCSDNSATFFVHIRRVPGASDTCASYGLSVTNGK